MTPFQEFKKIMPTVKAVLEKNEEARDNDNILCLLIWEMQFSGEVSFEAFKIGLLNKTFAAPETIGRARRKVQEKHIPLRGKLYSIRHKADIDFANQLRLFNE